MPVNYYEISINLELKITKRGGRLKGFQTRVSSLIAVNCFALFSQRRLFLHQIKLNTHLHRNCAASNEVWDDFFIKRGKEANKFFKTFCRADKEEKSNSDHHRIFLHQNA